MTTSSYSSQFGDNIDYLVKVVMIGDSGVGKSCLLKQLCEHKFEDGHVSTIGVDFGIRTLSLNSKVVKLQIWDTAGQDRFRSITASYYRGADTVLLVFDVCNPESFENVLKYWHKEVAAYANKEVQMILVANKIDQQLQRKVSSAEVEQMAKRLNILFIETSAKTSQNVMEAFASVATAFIRHKTAKQLTDNRSSFSEGEGKGVSLTDDKSVACPSCTIL